MSGGTNGTEFKSEIFSKRRIVVAPILIIIAFIMCYSIMMKNIDFFEYIFLAIIQGITEFLR